MGILAKKREREAALAKIKEVSNDNPHIGNVSSLLKKYKMTYTRLMTQIELARNYEERIPPSAPGDKEIIRKTDPEDKAELEAAKEILLKHEFPEL